MRAKADDNIAAIGHPSPGTNYGVFDQAQQIPAIFGGFRLHPYAKTVKKHSANQLTVNPDNGYD